MKRTIALLGFLATLSLAAAAQVEPAATGPSRPTGTLTYSLHDAESAWWSSGLGDQQSNSASGIVSWANGKSHRTFSVNYSGGYTWSLSGATYGSGYFQMLSLSETISGRKWRLSISNALSLRPQAPEFGVSGIPGEPVTGPPATGEPTENVLTENTRVINNGTRANFSVPLSFQVSFFAGANYSILRYPSGNGLDTNAFSFNAGASRRITKRASLSGEFQLADFTYSGSDISFKTTSVIATLSNSFRKGLSAHVSFGPEWVLSAGGSAIPSSTRYSLSAGVVYHHRLDSFSADYYHGDNSGSGIFYGSQFNSLTGNYSRVIENTFYLSARAGYEENSGFAAGSGSTSGVFAGASVSRRLGKLFSVAATYTLTEQTASTQIQDNVLRGVLQGATISVGYAPKGMHLEH